MWRISLASGVLFPMRAKYSVEMYMSWSETLISDLTVSSSQYDILLCSETLVSDLRHVSAFLVTGFGTSYTDTRGMAAYARDGCWAFRRPKFECSCCKMLVLGFVV